MCMRLNSGIVFPNIPVAILSLMKLRKQLEMVQSSTRMVFAVNSIWNVPNYFRRLIYFSGEFRKR